MKEKQQTDYAVILRGSQSVEKFQVFKVSEKPPIDDEDRYYIPVNETYSEIVVVDEDTNLKDMIFRTEILHPNAQIGSRYYPDIEQFSPVLATSPWVDYYVFDKKRLEWVPPQMSNDKVTHIWSNFEQDYIEVKVNE